MESRIDNVYMEDFGRRVGGIGTKLQNRGQGAYFYHPADICLVVGGTVVIHAGSIRQAYPEEAEARRNAILKFDGYCHDAESRYSSFLKETFPREIFPVDGSGPGVYDISACGSAVSPPIEARHFSHERKPEARRRTDKHYPELNVFN